MFTAPGFSAALDYLFRCYLHRCERLMAELHLEKPRMHRRCSCGKEMAQVFGHSLLGADAVSLLETLGMVITTLQTLTAKKLRRLLCK